MIRKMFVQDEDAHWYAIAEEDYSEFQFWATGEPDYKGKSFDDCMLGIHISNFSFVDLQQRGQQEPCTDCGGTGWQEISIDMAIDAGDRSMAGSRTPCPTCRGNGWRNG